MRLLLPALLLTGCATQDPTPDSSYFMVSRGQAGFVQQIFGADISYCKLTQNNLSGVTFLGTVSVKGKSCEVEVTAEATEQ